MITKEEVKKIADLARLQLSTDEISQASSHISDVLTNFETIRSIDTTDVAPADDVSGRKNSTREDVVRESILGTPEELLKHAITQDGYVVVSAVFSDTEIV